MGTNPAQSNIGLEAKMQRAREVLQLASLGSHSYQRPHSGHRGHHTQRRRSGPKQHLASSATSQMLRLECIHPDSAAQHSRLPFPSNFQKYRSHTAPARAAEKSLGSDVRKPTQAAPAWPEIPPSPVASPCDPIYLRCPGQL